MLKKDDLRPETGKWNGSTKLTIVDGQYQIISDCGLVNTPSVWVDTDNSWAKEGISPEGRHQLAVQLIGDFLQRNASCLSREQFNQLFRVRCLLNTDTDITDEDRDWADKELNRFLGDKQR